MYSIFFYLVTIQLKFKNFLGTPFNSLGTEGPSTIMNVIVQHPPEFTLKPKSVYIQKLNDTVTMHCSARDKHTDDDRSLIVWTRKDGISLPFGRFSLVGGNLTLVNVTANDRGTFCFQS
jgi:hypothetical protein